MAVALLDVDGTLVDTNYQHALAWFRAFARHDVVLPLWRIHRHIGMGGDQLVEALTDERTEDDLGDAIRATEAELYMEMIGEVRPMERARELLGELGQRGHRVVLASSAKPHEVERYLDLLDARPLADCWTTAGEVRATKPHPDLIARSLAKAEADAGEAVMVGDSTWDVRAAQHAGVRSLGVLTGGFAPQELCAAGAANVFESVSELLDRLDQTDLR